MISKAYINIRLICIANEKIPCAVPETLLQHPGIVSAQRIWCTIPVIRALFNDACEKIC